MTDIVDENTRSRMMAGIRGKNTKPEILVRRFLHGRGFRYRLHDRVLPGRPDIVLPRYRTAIFVNGCFWHRHPHCRLAYFPKSNAEKWNRKFTLNVARDNINQSLLLTMGWRVIVAWECGLRKNSEITLRLLEHSIRKPIEVAEVIQLPSPQFEKLQ